MLINCCKDCEERHPKCHATCERYNGQREMLRKEAEARQAERILDDAINENKAKTKDRWRRGHK